MRPPRHRGSRDATTVRGPGPFSTVTLKSVYFTAKVCYEVVLREDQVMTRSTFRTAAGVLAAWLFAAAAAAQNVTGTISGTVVDPQKQVVPGATVTVINEGTGDARVVVTDTRGAFQAANLQPASYTVRVEMQGFRTIERKANVLTAAERLSLGTLALEVGALGETIVVEAAGTHVNTGESQHSA